MYAGWRFSVRGNLEGWIYVVQEEEEEGKEGVDQTQIADCRLQTTLLGEF
jgi:hypothetical protein